MDQTLMHEKFNLHQMSPHLLIKINIIPCKQFIYIYQIFFDSFCHIRSPSPYLPYSGNDSIRQLPYHNKSLLYKNLRQHQRSSDNTSYLLPAYHHIRYSSLWTFQISFHTHLPQVSDPELLLPDYHLHHNTIQTNMPIRWRSGLRIRSSKRYCWMGISIMMQMIIW